MIKKWIIKFLKRLIKIVEEQEDDVFSEVDFKEWEKSICEISEKDRNEYV